MSAETVIDVVGATPLVRLEHLVPHNGSEVWVKLEGNNPAGSIKDRAARSMIEEAEKRGDIKPGDALVEATSGNTGIALAMIAALKGYRMKIILPANSTAERCAAIQAYGAELILSPAEKGMEGARDLANAMAQRGEGWQLDQFNNPDNPLAHYRTTGPEIWTQTAGRVTHFVSAMGTTGTITGTSRFLKEKNPNVRVVGLQPAEGSRIPGIRRWPAEYRPGIYRPELVDETLDILQKMRKIPFALWLAVRAFAAASVRAVRFRSASCGRGQSRGCDCHDHLRPRRSVSLHGDFQSMTISR